MGKLLRLVFGIPAGETRCDRRGFQAEARARDRLETIGATFVAGYHAALEVGTGPALEARLEGIDLERRGFAYEGAGMALQLLDLLTPGGGNRCAAFLAGAGRRHNYMVHVGAGWAFARMHWPVARRTARMDPLLRWLVLDGWGFHDGYFHPQRSIDRQQVSGRIPVGYPRRAHDQGLGRALWFARGADAGRVAAALERFTAERHGDLWSGVGLAAAYAGGTDAAGLEVLRAAAGRHLAALAQGAAFAAEARRQAENPAPHTELACRVLCGVSAQEAAAWTATTRVDLPPDAAEPAYEIWRARMRERFTSQVVAQ